jgi:tryptophanyl-tRNA synthetase
MRPTGKLHIGHWVGALANWARLQEDYRCFFMVADWHALMSEYKNPFSLRRNSLDNLSDWLAYGINPQKAVIFRQSEIDEHLELAMILSAITPLGWLYRCPTFKEQIAQLKEKDVNTYAFLGYPVLQAADIVIYKANFVPVGEDQLPHLELCREIVRRFAGLYKKELFVEPQPILTAASRLLGLDGRKMSKSYENYISLDEEDETIDKKVLSMITDPARMKKEDKGHPDICNVFAYYEIFKKEMHDEVFDWCVNAKKGCKDCKKFFAQILKDFIAPRREKKREIIAKEDYLLDILREGNKQAKEVASRTMAEVKETLGL